MNMRTNVIVLALVLMISLIGCGRSGLPTLPAIDTIKVPHGSNNDSGGYIPWGFWDLTIQRDGSYAEVVPNRSSNDTTYMWGYHMNVVKFLEVDPCTNCLSISNIHLLPNSDVSVDISLRHPFMDARFTGFDVRGIIMFPASQYWPDNGMREKLGLEPFDYWRLRIANHEHGDAELMNPDGWTNVWASEEGTCEYESLYYWYKRFMPIDLPIFRYYQGKFASGEHLSTLSAFKRYYSTEVRHMFEVGHAVTRTYIIRPPATGPIMASYAVYAHWYPADNVPVINPAVDFPPEANSPLPYEFYITQDSPLDVDNPDLQEEHDKVHWHIKTWSIEYKYWTASGLDFLGQGTGGGMVPHPSGEPDDYVPTNLAYFWYNPYLNDGDAVTAPMLLILNVRNPKDMPPNIEIGKEIYIAQLEYAAIDGVW